MSSDPFEKAKASLGDAWKAARGAAESVKKEIERAGIVKSLDDAGREIARAAGSVATHVGAELEELGREIRVRAEPGPPPASPEAGPAAGPAPPEGHTPSASAGTEPAGAGSSPPAPGHRAGEAYAPEAPDAATGEPKEPPSGGFRIAADDEPRR